MVVRSDDDRPIQEFVWQVLHRVADLELRECAPQLGTIGAVPKVLTRRQDATRQSRRNERLIA